MSNRKIHFQREIEEYLYFFVTKNALSGTMVNVLKLGTPKFLINGRYKQWRWSSVYTVCHSTMYFRKLHKKQHLGKNMYG